MLAVAWVLLRGYGLRQHLRGRKEHKRIGKQQHDVVEYKFLLMYKFIGKEAQVECYKVQTAKNKGQI
jgi:hypothetical protein